MGKPVVIPLLPVAVDRATSPDKLPGDVARLLQWCDVTALRGCLRRADGPGPTVIPAYNGFVTNAHLARGRDGRAVLLGGTTGGKVLGVTPDASTPTVWSSETPSSVFNPWPRTGDPAAPARAAHTSSSGPDIIRFDFTGSSLLADESNPSVASAWRTLSAALALSTWQRWGVNWRISGLVDVPLVYGSTPHDATYAAYLDLYLDDGTTVSLPGLMLVSSYTAGGTGLKEITFPPPAAPWGEILMVSGQSGQITALSESLDLSKYAYLGMRTLSSSAAPTDPVSPVYVTNEPAGVAPTGINAGFIYVDLMPGTNPLSSPLVSIPVMYIEHGDGPGGQWFNWYWREARVASPGTGVATHARWRSALYDPLGTGPNCKIVQGDGGATAGGTTTIIGQPTAGGTPSHTVTVTPAEGTSLLGSYGASKLVKARVRLERTAGVGVVGQASLTLNYVDLQLIKHVASGQVLNV